MSEKIFAENTQSVLSKIKNDFLKTTYVVNILVTIIFMFLYGYKIYCNLDKALFLIIYIILAFISIVSFVVFLSTYKVRKNIIVKRTKRSFRIMKYLTNAVMIAVVLIEMYNYGSTDFNKIITIVSIVSLVAQIFIEISRILFENYTNLLISAIKMDIDPYKEKFEKLTDPKGLGLSLIEKMIPGKKIVDEQDVYLTKDEQRVLEYTEKNRENLLKNKERKEELVKEKHQEQKDRIKAKLSNLNPFKKKEKNEE